MPIPRDNKAPAPKLSVRALLVVAQRECAVIVGFAEAKHELPNHLDIAEESEIGRLIESVAAREQLSREEAAFKLSQGNGTVHPPAAEAEEQRRAAIERFTGCLKEDNPQMADAWRRHFDEEHYADIERENQRNLV